MYRSDPDKSATVSRYFSVALGLLCLGQQENCEPTIDALRTIQHPIGKYAEVMVLASAYLGTGNVVKI
jgi:26S proteasome regulatory subunit N1